MRDGSILCTTDSGRFFASSREFVERLGSETLDTRDHVFLEQEGLSFGSNDARSRVPTLARAVSTGPTRRSLPS